MVFVLFGGFNACTIYFLLMYLLFALGTKMLLHISSALKFSIFGVEQFLFQSCKIYIYNNLSAVVINIVFKHFTILFVMQAAHFKMSIKMCSTITITPDTFSGNECLHLCILLTLW